MHLKNCLVFSSPMHVAGDERVLDDYLMRNKVEKFVIQTFFFIFSNVVR